MRTEVTLVLLLISSSTVNYSNSSLERFKFTLASLDSSRMCLETIVTVKQTLAVSPSIIWLRPKIWLVWRTSSTTFAKDITLQISVSLLVKLSAARTNGLNRLRLKVTTPHLVAHQKTVLMLNKFCIPILVVLKSALSIKKCTSRRMLTMPLVNSVNVNIIGKLTAKLEANPKVMLLVLVSSACLTVHPRQSMLSVMTSLSLRLSLFRRLLKTLRVYNQMLLVLLKIWVKVRSIADLTSLTVWKITSRTGTRPNVLLVNLWIHSLFLTTT